MYRNDDSKRRSVSLDETPRGSWASSIFDLKNSSPDALLPSVLERTAAEDMDHKNTEARSQGRHSDLLGLYPPPDEKGLGSLSSTEHTLTSLVPPQHKEKLEKLRLQAEQACSRLGRFRMPFAWTAIHLLNIVSSVGGLDRSDPDSDSGTTPLSPFSWTSNSYLCTAFTFLQEKNLHVFTWLVLLLERKTHGTWNEKKKKGFERMSVGEEMCNFATFRPATLTVTNFFKQVRLSATV
ncbi:hypothetical protein XENOCAPTIV_026909 [Xenoophorus captivus]|uniref:Uncharacterized protein n=1 Tax=Xenoophorus captivus TaxID=1517983 RepID=A0ABV0QP11_9TELE